MTRLRKLNLAALAAFMASISVQCGGEDIGQPPTASAIEMAGGDGQVASVGAPLPNPLVVLVTDDAGDPVEGVTVQWATEGEGDVSPQSAQTGSDGKASATRMLGATAGQQITTAAVSGLQGSPVTFTATATDGTTPTLAITTPPSPTAQSGVAFAAQPVIQLKDGSGADLTQSGVAVTAALGSGTGTLGGTLTRNTDNTGAATFTDLAITGAAGSYTITFTASGYVQVTSATITVSGAAAGITITTNPPTAALTGEVFDPAVQPVVQVKDASGQPVASVPVTASVASGGGTLEGTITATSDASGFAKFGDLGIKGTGAQTLQFTAGTSSHDGHAAPLGSRERPPDRRARDRRRHDAVLRGACVPAGWPPDGLRRPQAGRQGHRRHQHLRPVKRVVRAGAAQDGVRALVSHGD
jgi:hypothetical protein